MIHMEFKHISAMPDEVIYYLNPRPGGIYVDGTLGGAGHASAILKRITPGGTLVGIDQDMDAIKNAREKLSQSDNNVHLINDNFAHLPEILSTLSIEQVDGIIIDIGLSQHQLEGSGRGFSFMRDEPLDMRMNTDADVDAAHIVNTMAEKELADLIYKFGEERFSRQIARRIVARRAEKRIDSSRDFANIVSGAIPRKVSAKQKIHPATRTFQALRIAVNRELERLETFMDSFPEWLKPGGRLCVLSFHSLEDRIVKKKFKELSRGCTCPSDFPICVCHTEPTVKVLTRKVVKPSAEEVEANPMARSTRLRACEKL